MGYVRTVDFSETVTTRAQLREVLAEPSEFVTNKEFVELDEFGRDFIARSPFVLIASSDGGGSIDVSPKGDPAGFIKDAVKAARRAIAIKI